MREPEMDQIGVWIADVLTHIGDAAVEQRVRAQVAELAARFPIYESRTKKAPATRAEHANV
jgi:glycine hydroxymethyltransferase